MLDWVQVLISICDPIPWSNWPQPLNMPSRHFMESRWRKVTTACCGSICTLRKKVELKRLLRGAVLKNGATLEDGAVFGCCLRYMEIAPLLVLLLLYFYCMHIHFLRKYTYSIVECAIISTQEFCMYTSLKAYTFAPFGVLSCTLRLWTEDIVVWTSINRYSRYKN